jgi:uncharacterized iron-regulated membrane protein
MTALITIFLLAHFHLLGVVLGGFLIVALLPLIVALLLGLAFIWPLVIWSGFATLAIVTVARNFDIHNVNEGSVAAVALVMALVGFIIWTTRHGPRDPAATP